MNVVVALGEMMGHFASSENLRLRQTCDFEVTYAGAEASMAASICNFGGKARYVIALPKHALAEATMDSIRAVGIDTQYVLRTDTGRLGLYFPETGANQRPGNVSYDRESSSIFCRWTDFSHSTPELSHPQTTLRFAVAASCLKHAIKGDFNYSTCQEVEAFMGGSAFGRIVR